MAIVTGITHYDGSASIDLYPSTPKSGVMDFPDARQWPLDFNYDEKLARGEHEFLGLFVLDVSLITDKWLAELDKLALPRVDVPEAGLFDAIMSDVLH